MRHGDRPWTQYRFIEELDLFVARESMDDDIRLVILPWIMTRLDDPYGGVRRVAGMEHEEMGNLWFGGIAETDAVPGTLVACSYWISERSRALRCNSYALLPALR